MTIVERLVTAALATISFYVLIYRQYGVITMFTRKYAKHAAIGRARFRFFNRIQHRITDYSATDLVAKLQMDRAKAALAAA